MTTSIPLRIEFCEIRSLVSNGAVDTVERTRFATFGSAEIPLRIEFCEILEKSSLLIITYFKSKINSFNEYFSVFL